MKRPQVDSGKIAFPQIAPAIPVLPGFLNRGLELRLHWLAQPGDHFDPSNNALTPIVAKSKPSVLFYDVGSSSADVEAYVLIGYAIAL